MTSITTLYAKAPEVLFDVRMMSANKFLRRHGDEACKYDPRLHFVLEIIETLPWVSSDYLVAIFGPIMIMSTMTRSCFRNVGDAGNTSLVDAGTPLGATAVVTPGSAGYLLWGVLHPGVPVMWYGHIRDLFPTAGGCMGSRLPNVTLLHWAQQKSALV